MSNCPCGSEAVFEQCCLPYISKERNAPTAEALMRSRYCAYVKCEVDYILETNDVATRDDINREEIESWSNSSQWKGLEIVATEKGQEKDLQGIVEFKAKYINEGKDVVHHEKSQFIKTDGQWFFKDGEVIRGSYRRDQPKIGRNDPCLCGSGKKYKKCCY